MQTQCPKCETLFRITDAQLEAADGQVRCSRCGEVFTAVTINEDISSTNTEQDIDLPEINADIEQKNDREPFKDEHQSPETSEQDSASLLESDTEAIHDTETTDNNNVVELELNNDNSEPSEDNQSSDHDISEEAITDTERNDDFDDQPNTQENDNEEVYLNEQNSLSDTDVILDNNTDIEVDDNEKNQKQNLDLFQDDNNQDSPQIIPDELRHGVASNDTTFSENLAWTSGILLLSSILLTQYFWFNRDTFVDSPKFQTFAEQACQNIDCSKIAIRDPAHIELLTRNVFSHPDEKDALMINVALQNNSKFSQPYPVLQINFSDIRGDAIVARRFTSDEYLAKSEQEKKHLLQPGGSADFNLEIEDPGKQAITYEFNFL